jgi:hypothetical protein
MPDQQAGSGEDPWEAAPVRADSDSAGDTEDDGDETPGSGGDTSGPGGDVPDTDEAGTGRRGAPRTGDVHPEHPAPGESSG